MSPEACLLAAGLVLGVIFREFLPELIWDAVALALGLLWGAGKVLLWILIGLTVFFFPIGVLVGILVWSCWPARKSFK